MVTGVGMPIQPGEPRVPLPVFFSVWAWISQLWSPLVMGKIDVCDPLYEAPLPFDIGRALVLLSVLLALIGLVIFGSIISLVVFVVLAIVGLGTVCLLPAAFSMLVLTFGPLLYWLRGGKNYPVVNFQVVDQQTSVPARVVMRIRKGGGTFRLGDHVRIFGRRDRRSGQVFTHRVDICESNRRLISYRVYGVRHGLVGWLACASGCYFWVLPAF